MPTELTLDIPKGLCQCGCGGKTKIISKPFPRQKRIRGESSRYIHGHHGRRPLQDRFWEKVIKTGTCWNWTGAKSPFGYGVTFMNGKTIRAHRASWILHHGYISHGMSVLHRCDHPACVNPKHLSVGTQADNMKDCALKKRTARGEENGQSKLTADIVRAAREERERQGTAFRTIADRHGVDRNTMTSAIKGKTWRAI